jgi:septal ring factor EnvC (AmiA/AmiB activator)
MFRNAAWLLLALGLMAAATARAQSTLWNCKDKDGRTTITSQKDDTVGKDCRIVQQERVTVVPASKASAKSPAGFPKETTADRAASKAKQRDTIEKELGQEQSLLADARKKLSEQEATRGGDEKNYSRVLERLKPYQDTVEVHEKNVEALKRELVNLSR